MPALQEILGYFLNWKSLPQFCGMGILPVLVLLGDQMPALQKIWGYFLNWKSLPQFCGMGILPVLVLLAGKMPALQKILGYFLNWKSLKLSNFCFLSVPCSLFPVPFFCNNKLTINMF
jgi:hypothetical protein